MTENKIKNKTQKWYSNLEVKIRPDNLKIIKTFGTKYLGTQKRLNSTVTDFLIDLARDNVLANKSDNEVATMFIEWKSKQDILKLSNGGDIND